MLNTQNQRTPVGYAAPRRLYLDKAGKVVEDGDAAGVELLAPQGGRLPLHVARKHGLVDENGTPIEPQTPTAPKQNKAKTPDNAK